MKTHGYGRVGFKTQSFWLIQVMPDHALLPSTALSPEIWGVTIQHISSPWLAIPISSLMMEEFHRSSTSSMIWDHSMQLIIEINNWWLEPSVLPLANTLLSCEISATCNLQALQRHGGCPLHIQGSTALLLPTHSHNPMGCHTSPERHS